MTDQQPIITYTYEGIVVEGHAMTLTRGIDLIDTYCAEVVRTNYETGATTIVWRGSGHNRTPAGKRTAQREADSKAKSFAASLKLDGVCRHDTHLAELKAQRAAKERRIAQADRLRKAAPELYKLVKQAGEAGKSPIVHAYFRAIDPTWHTRVQAVLEACGEQDGDA